MTLEQLQALQALLAKAEELVSGIRVVLDLSLPSKPTNVSASADEARVVITWDEAIGAPNIDHYNIYRDGVLIGTDSLPDFEEASVADGTYVYAVAAVDGNFREGPQGSAPSVIVSVTPPLPGKPINFTATPVSTTQINLAWAAGPGGTPDDYDADISTTGTGGWTALTPLTGPTALSYQATGLTPSTQYFFRVRANIGTTHSQYATTNATTDAPATSREVYYTGTFETGAVGTNGSLTAGGLFECKYQPEGGVNTFYSNADDGYDSLNSAGFDMRIRQSETFDSVSITPRRGSYFMPQVLWYGKEYECINGTTSGANDQLDKPRIKYQLSNTAYQADFDREIWTGFSCFTHPNHIHDVATRAHQGGNYHYWVNAGNQLTQFYLTTFGRPLTAPNARWSGGVGGSTEYWIIGYQVNATAVADMTQSFSGTKTYYAALADRADDVGLWCDWVFRFRLNPFTVSTNASSVDPAGKNHVYQGNKGICQIWKSTGPYLNANRDRAMTKVFDLYNEPFGGVPPAAERVHQHFGIYKYGWKKNPSSNTGANAWIYNAKDEIRFGFRKAKEAGEVIDQFGTKDIDVNPSGNTLSGWVEQ